MNDKYMVVKLVVFFIGIVLFTTIFIGPVIVIN